MVLNHYTLYFSQYIFKLWLIKILHIAWTFFVRKKWAYNWLCFTQHGEIEFSFNPLTDLDTGFRIRIQSDPGSTLFLKIYYENNFEKLIKKDIASDQNNAKNFDQGSVSGFGYGYIQMKFRIRIQIYSI